MTSMSSSRLNDSRDRAGSAADAVESAAGYVGSTNDTGRRRSSDQSPRCPRTREKPMAKKKGKKKDKKKSKKGKKK